MDGLSVENLAATLKRPKAISLTPLIDVVFILLMFFMLTSSFIRERQIELASPVASTAIEAAQPQVLLLNAGGMLSTADKPGQKLTDAMLLKGLESARPVVISPEKQADVQTIVATLTRLKALGLEQLSLTSSHGEQEHGGSL